VRSQRSLKISEERRRRRRYSIRTPHRYLVSEISKKRRSEA